MAGRPALRHPDRLAPALLALIIGGLLTACTTPPERSAVAPPTPSRSATPVPSPAPSPTPVASAASSATGGVYLALGDSITFGIGVDRPQEEGYVARVASALGDASATMQIAETRVFAIPGETAAGFLDTRLDDVLRAVGEYGPRVELVTIGLGANELLRTRRDPACEADRAGPACAAAVESATATAVAALDEIVAAVQAALADAGSDARILLLAYYNPDPDPLADATIAGPDGIVACTTGEPGFDDRIACVADARGVEIVDLHAAFRGRELELTGFAAGDVHPNAAGYDVIAGAILAVVGEPPR